jgi:endonuclease/exonuclease/phosphatase (EEP) superfamily protein YafD
MTELGTDQLTAVAEASGNVQLTPAEMAARVAALADNGRALGAGTLPVWDRVSEPRKRTWVSRLLHAAAWCVTLALLAVAVLRISYHDAAPLLIWFNAFTLYVYLPAYVILAVAIRRKHGWLTAATTAVVLCHLSWLVTDFRPATKFKSASATTASASTSAAAEVSPPIRVFFANVRTTNENFDGILDEIASTNPDVVVLVEFHRRGFVFKSPQWETILKPYVHGTSLADQHPGEVVVFSKLPISGQQHVWSAGRVCNLVDIPLAAESLRLFCLHSPRPYLRAPQYYKKYWEEIPRVVSEQPRPLVVIGDFNATQHSLVHQEITSLGLRSAHVDRGRGYATSWPNGKYLAPPIRIDHAFLSPNVECLDIAEGTGAGSDHKPLILDIRVHRAEESPDGA